VRVVWAAAARDDRRRIAAWLAERNKAAAVRVARALAAAADSLAALPAKGRPGRMPDTRELSAVPPYVVVYRVNEVAGVVRILRIWHTAQDR
jgi:toxin ParE1/3/4